VGRHPVVALLTDFGLRDHYVGVMKGVILRICPSAVVVDITHDIAPQDVTGGAFELAAAFRYFPEGTVFVVVVDPGVGSERLAIAADAGGYRFVGPDNGVFSLVFREHRPAHVVELRERRFALPDISRTFEGRDRFAPAAAWLAQGTSITEFGPAVIEWTRLAVPEPVGTGTAIDGEVIKVDRFGNLITNITRRDVGRLQTAAPRVTVEGRTLHGLVEAYANRAPGTICALYGSAGFLEIASASGSASELLQAGRGTPVRVSVDA
jgi:S-adenosylmethionine hydrolase